MSKNIIVTNLRVEKNLWLQIKQLASEVGMSANEYMNLITQQAVSKASLTIPAKTHIKRKRKNIYDALLSLSNKKYKRKPLGLSENDKIIYGL